MGKIEMKAILMIMIAFTTTNLFSDVPMKSFAIKDLKNSHIINLGDKLSAVFKVYGEVKFILKKYSNIEHRQYQYKDIIFSSNNIGDIDPEDNSIVAIEFTNPSIKLINNIGIGSSKKIVLKILGKPEESKENILYYYNHEWDLMEMIIIFDNKNKVAKIEISMGT